MQGQHLTEADLESMSPEQIAELQKKNCIFCQINEGKIPAKKVYEDELCFAILDINPASKGHMLLLPKEHYLLLPQVPDETIKHLAKIAKLLSKSALRDLGAEGTNIFIANGVAAGQRAPHMMLHIIPRNEGDGITCFELPEKSIREDDIAGMQRILAQKLGTDINSMHHAAPSPKESKHEQKHPAEKMELDEFKEMLK